MYLKYDDNKLASNQTSNAGILDLFFNKTLIVTDSFRNKFRALNYVKMRYYIKIYGK